MYVPDHGSSAVTARTLQGMARVRSGQAPAWPLVSGRSVRSGSGVKREFACPLTGALPLELVALRSQSRLRLEGRTRTLSGPSPDLSPTRTLCAGWLAAQALTRLRISAEPRVASLICHCGPLRSVGIYGQRSDAA